MTTQISEFNRILVTRMKFIGDIVLTTPVIRSIRNTCPDAYVAYMGAKDAVTLLEHNPNLDEIIGYDFSRPAILEQIRVALLLRQRKFDLVIDLFGNPRSALLTYLSGARTRVGLERKGRGKLYTIRVADDGSKRNAIEFHDRFARAVGMLPVSTQPEIVVTDEEKADAQSLLGEYAGGIPSSELLIGVHPGATWPAKRWAADRFVKLADRLMSELGGRVVVTAGPGDGNTIREVRSSASTKLILLPVMPLRQLAAVISFCNVYISNDAGPMHISAAVGTPTIGIFGPGEEDIWFPYAAAGGHQALRKTVPCHPCHLDFCNREGEGFMECMKLLTVNDVFEAVKLSPRQKYPHLSR